MKTEIHFVNAVKNEALEILVNEKLDQLESKYDWVVSAYVFLKTNNSSDGKNYECEIRLSVPGPQLFVHTCETNFNKAILEAVQELTMVLKKKKEKFFSNN